MNTHTLAKANSNELLLTQINWTHVNSEKNDCVSTENCVINKEV